MKIKDLKQLFAKRGNAREVIVGLLCVTIVLFSEPVLANIKNDAALQQQNQITVKGTVVDKEGKPLVGAAIMDTKTGEGVTAGLDGEFSIRTSANQMLEVLYIGYMKESFKATENPVTIVLREDRQALDEVVVVGYGTSTKRALISSVTTVSTADMENLPISNITQSLAGRAAGLIVQQTGGGVDKVATISIRGGGTPLIVIDGIVRNYNDFVNMAPDDIQSFSILKDASATAVYGSRAANGIIQIVTKKGKEGKPSIEYTFNYSIAEPAYWPEPMDSWVRADYANIAKANDGLPASFSPERIQKMKDGSDPQQNSNIKWRELVLRDFAPQQKHSIRLSGGTENNQYYASINFIGQESLYINNNHNMQRTNFLLSQVSNIENTGLKISVTIDGYLQQKTHPYTSTVVNPGQVFQMIQNRSPLVPGTNSFGLPYNVTGNIYAELSADTGYINNDENVINGDLAVEWSLPWVEGLKLRAKANYRYGLKTNKNWRKDPAKYDWESKDPVFDAKPQLFNETEYGHRYTMQYFAHYDRTFGKHTVSALAGYEATYGLTSNYWASRENYQFPIDQIPVGPESTQKNGGWEAESGRAGWVGQLKYNYDNRYFAEGSIRYDGSDNFPVDKRWGTFFSGSLGWSISDERFMATLKQKNVFNQLKIRASYGQVGLDNWGKAGEAFHVGRFEYLPSYGLDNKAWVLGGAYVPGFSEGSIPSPDISWFTTEQFDVGLDFSSLNDRLYGTVDYFFYKTSGFLYSPSAIDVGYTDPLGKNLPRVSTNGEHRRAGFDFSLGWRDAIGDFTYDIAANLTKFDQLWAFDPSESITDMSNPYKRSSQQVGFWGNMYQNLGFYNSAEDVLNSVKRVASSNLTAGDLKYYDFNGDGRIDGADQIRSGKNGFPRANYGINIKLGYKGFFLSTLIQGATRYDMYITGTAAMHGGQTAELPVIYDYQTDFWTPDNTDARYPRLTSNPGATGNNNFATSDFWLVNGAYIRMKDLQIGYNFKRIAKNVTWLKTATLVLSGQNLITISEATKYGVDPEAASVEHFGYPNERTYSIGLNIGF